MDKTKQKIVQYLSEAHATEQALVTVLRSQIAMTPRGSYRDALETHLRETRDHAVRVQRRLDELAATITHFKFLKAALLSRFPDVKPSAPAA